MTGKEREHWIRVSYAEGWEKALDGVRRLVAAFIFEKKREPNVVEVLDLVKRLNGMPDEVEGEG